MNADPSMGVSVKQKPPAGYPAFVMSLTNNSRVNSPKSMQSQLSVVLWVLAVVTLLYVFAIRSLWRKRRWALRICWMPVVGMLIVGSVGLAAMLAQDKAIDTVSRVMFSIVLIPGILLVPLQWRIRRDFKAGPAHPRK